MNHYSKKAEVSLSDRMRALILGSLLGDGSLKIHKGYQNARFSFRHSTAQKEYFYWKCSEFSHISSEKNIFIQKPDGWSKNEKLRFQSLALSCLTDLYQLTHKHHRFLIRRKWLNLLTPLSLMVWWCDDGSIIANGRKGVLCTDDFDEKSVRRLAQYLEVRWNIYTHVGFVGRKRLSKREKYFRLWFSTEELKKFFLLTLPFLSVPGMIYKFLLLYRDPELQQRWISEIVRLSHFSFETVQAVLQDRKRHLKAFRE